MVNPLHSILELLGVVIRVFAGIWEWLIPVPIIQNNPGVSIVCGALLLVFLKSVGSSDERESLDAFDEWIVDVLIGLKRIFQSLSSLAYVLSTWVYIGVRSVFQNIRESDDISIVSVSIIDFSNIGWKVVVVLLGLLGFSFSIAWVNGLF